MLLMLTMSMYLGACIGGMHLIKTPYASLQKEANKIVKDGGLAVVGTGSSKRESGARDKAQNDGNTKLGRALEVKVKSYEKRFFEEIGTADDSEINEAFNQVSEQLSKQVLNGILPREEKMTKGEGIYKAYVLMVIDPKTFMQSFQDQMKKQKVMYTKYRQSEMSREMEEKIKGYDDF